MKHLNFLSNLLSLSLGSQSSEVGVISEEGAIEHPFSTYSAPFGTRWKPAGNQHSLSMCAVMFVLLFVVGVGNVWGAYSATFNRIADVTELSTGDSVMLVLQDGKTTTSGLAITEGGNSANCSSVAISSGPSITCTNSKLVWKVTITDGTPKTYTFTRGTNYVTWKSTTDVPCNTSSNTTTWTIAKLSSGYFMIQSTGTNNRYIARGTSDVFKAYLTSNFVNQMELATKIALAQYHGAMSIYKKGSSCANSVTISNGTATNCDFSLSPNGAQASCDGVTTTISITPNTGYGTPVVTESGASSTPTPGGSGNTQTLTYAANTTGTSIINVSCSANTYTINLNNESATTAGTSSITATFNDDDNLDGTPAISVPAKTGWTFGGYYTSTQGGGTQIIAANGNVNASASDATYTYTDGSKNWKYAGNITLYAKWTCSVTWSVNKATDVYSAQTVTYNSSGCKVGSVPSGSDLDLENDYCGDKFVGWTSDENYVHGTSNLFTNVAGSPNITGNTTFYAVFADYDDED